jgi:predicted alpha/beta-hydrolase family hydrolase
VRGRRGARGLGLMATTLRVATPRGEAVVALDRPRRRSGGLLVLGHGAGGDIDAVDLVAVRDATVRSGWVVARVTQPYRVMGARRPPPAAPVLDAAWIAAVAAIRGKVGLDVPLVVGGRSSGARVACRTAVDVGAVGILALAFPLHPPGRPEVSRASELDPTIPTLVINGDRDAFGVPEPAGLVRVVIRSGERHDLRKDPDGVATAAVRWLSEQAFTAAGGAQASP